MGKFWCLCVLALAACQPMYEAKPQTLRTPEPLKPPATLPGDDTAKVPPYNDDCAFLVDRTPTKPQRDIPKAQQHVQQGDDKVKQFDAAPPSAKPDLIIDGIDEYAAALRKDPFNAQATLKLALAYDKVRYRGCALALLGRLDQLAQSPKFRLDANSAIDEVEQRRKWFGGYRKDALRKVGRTGP
jgi:hypothetical protein